MKNNIRKEDYYKIEFATDMQISPNGKRILYVERHMVEKIDGYTSYINVIEEDGSKQLLTECSGNDYPRWSPNGEKILFLSTRNGKKELFVSNGQAMQDELLLSMPMGISFPSWSPDGKKISFLSQVKLREKTEYSHVNNIKHKDEMFGGVYDYSKKTHLYIYDLETKKVMKVTPDDFKLDNPEFSAIFSPMWSNDGKSLVFTAKVQDPIDHEFYPTKANVYTVNIESLAIKAVKNVESTAQKVIFSADDKEVYFYGHDSEFQRATSQRLCKINLEDQKFEMISKEFDRSIDNNIINDVTTLGYSDTYPKISKSNNEIYFLAGDRGVSSIFAMNLETREVKCIVGGERNIYSFSYSKEANRLCFGYSDAFLPNDIAVYDIDSNTEKRISYLNDEVLSGINLGSQERFDYIDENGNTQNGWMVKPPNFDENKKYPAVLNIHGGPYFHYGCTFTFDFQILAANGYIVLYANPRGSRGCGQEFTKGIKSHFAKPAYNDLMAFVDLAIKEKYVDEDNLGVMGQSYGGYMTNWIITQTNRFKVAIPQSGVSNWMTMFGSSDLVYTTNELLLRDEVTNLLDVWDISPLAHVKNVNTPTLFIHSEKDMRCPIDQAEQMYCAIKAMRKETELLTFPRSNHGLLRNGLPSFRMVRIDSIIEYLDRYLTKKNRELNT